LPSNNGFALAITELYLTAELQCSGAYLLHRNAAGLSKKPNEQTWLGNFEWPGLLAYFNSKALPIKT